MGYTPAHLNVNKIAGGISVNPGGVTTDDLFIYANSTDAVPLVKLLGADNIVLISTALLRIFPDGTNELNLGVTNPDYVINSITADYNIYLKPTGTGKVKFGTYTAGAKADSIGYIEVLDAGGTSRRLMVQSA